MEAPQNKHPGKDGKQLTRRPAREFKVGRSKDGKYWIFRDTTTWFIPTNYLSAISANAGRVQGGGDAPKANRTAESDGSKNDRSN